MKLQRIFTLAILFILVLFTSCDQPKKEVGPNPETKEIDYTQLVYPQLDTENSRWFFFSSASRPFGMVNLIPDTKLDGTWGSGYRYEVDTVKGFSHIHGWQLSGLSVLPVTLTNDNSGNIYKDFHSKFKHTTEKVSPGHHSLNLERYNIDVELASTKRVGLHKYTFPQRSNKAILFNLNGQLGPCKSNQGELQPIGDSVLQGNFVIAPTIRRPKPVKVFFTAALNTTIETVEKDTETGNYLLNLNTENDSVLMKVGISYTSIENAALNLKAELPNWDFDEVVLASKSEWNELLGRINVEGGTDLAKRRFYTDLWHALLGRKIINDVNGAYPDNMGPEFRVGQLPMKPDGTPEFNHYNSDAFWGAQWTINTLWGLVYPNIKKEFVMSLLQYQKDGGLIPRGPSGGNYTYVMTGSSSTPFIVSAIQQGLIIENLDSIYEALKMNHISGGIMEKSGYEHNTNHGGGLKYYLENGFVPYPIPEGKFGGHQEGASLTMEYAYQDFTLAQLAKKLGKKEDFDHYMERSKNYKHVYDSISGWMRPKNASGVWKEDFDPYQYENGFNESNGAQSTWFVPHDLSGLARIMGGKEKAIAKLDTQFKTAEKMNFTAGNSHDREMHPEYSKIPINYGNQPSMQTAFIFNELGRPDLTQKWSRNIVSKVFSGLSPSTGYNGDEDQGLMGSLSVLMKLGIFQMNGGVEENPAYQIGSPIFNKISIRLDPDFYTGKELIISAENNSDEHFLVEGAMLNNEPIDDFTISHQEITNGGHLKLKMVVPLQK